MAGTDFYSFPSWAKVGAKVVCISNGHIPEINRPPDGAAKNLVVGKEYTISWVGPSGRTDCPGGPIASVCLAEERSFWPSDMPPNRRGRWVGRFRPVVTLEQDMEAHFAQLLKTKEPV